MHKTKVGISKPNENPKTSVCKRKHLNMHKYLILISIGLINFSCAKDQLELRDPPNNLELDIDQDGNADFVVVYAQRTTGDPAGNYQEIKMTLESTGIDQILKNDDELPIFLNDIDLIQTEVNLPLYWEITNPSSNVSTPIATIRTGYDEITWNDKWTIFSSEEKETYLIGFKLLENNTSKIGFIEFSVSPLTGGFTLLRTEFL